MIEKLWDNIVQEIGANVKPIKWLGFAIAMSPTLWDIIRLGTKGFFEWRVYPLGICISILGAVIILSAEGIRKWFD